MIMSDARDTQSKFSYMREIVFKPLLYSACIILAADTIAGGIKYNDDRRLGQLESALQAAGYRKTEFALPAEAPKISTYWAVYKSGPHPPPSGDATVRKLMPVGFVEINDGTTRGAVRSTVFGRRKLLLNQPDERLERVGRAHGLEIARMGNRAYGRQ